VYALDAATGAKKWAYPIGGMDSSAAVTDGVVYVGALGGVYAFHLPGTRSYSGDRKG
jgi:serine/threonine-protein kinase